MSSGLGVSAPAETTSPVAQQPTPPLDDREKQRRDKAEQKRIQEMLDDEEKERRRREAEVEMCR